MLGVYVAVVPLIVTEPRVGGTTTLALVNVPELTVLASKANTKFWLFELNGPLHVIFLATGSAPALVDIDQLADVCPTVTPNVEVEPNVAGDVAFNLILSVFCTVKDVVLKVPESFLETPTPALGVTVTAVLMPVIVTVFDGHSTFLKLLVIGLNVIASGVVSGTTMGSSGGSGGGTVVLVSYTATEIYPI